MLTSNRTCKGVDLHSCFTVCSTLSVGVLSQLTVRCAHRKLLVATEFKLSVAFEFRRRFHPMSVPERIRPQQAGHESDHEEPRNQTVEPHAGDPITPRVRFVPTRVLSGRVRLPEGDCRQFLHELPFKPAMIEPIEARQNPHTPAGVKRRGKPSVVFRFDGLDQAGIDARRARHCVHSEIL